MFVAVVRANDGTPHVTLLEPNLPTRLHLVADADVDPLELDVALFESGAAVQLQDASYLISVDWLLQQLVAADIDSAAVRNNLVTTACGEDGYIPAVDAIRTPVERGNPTTTGDSGGTDPLPKTPPRS